MNDFSCFVLSFQLLPAMTTVEVFKTNVTGSEQAKELVARLLIRFPQSRINVDLLDCDKVLRVEGKEVCPHTIVSLVSNYGYYCEVLE